MEVASQIIFNLSVKFAVDHMYRCVLCHIRRPPTTANKINFLPVKTIAPMEVTINKTIVAPLGIPPAHRTTMTKIS